MLLLIQNYLLSGKCTFYCSQMLLKFVNNFPCIYLTSLTNEHINSALASSGHCPASREWLDVCHKPVKLMMPWWCPNKKLKEPECHDMTADQMLNSESRKLVVVKTDKQIMGRKREWSRADGSLKRDLRRKWINKTSSSSWSPSSLLILSRKRDGIFKLYVGNFRRNQRFPQVAWLQKIWELESAKDPEEGSLKQTSAGLSRIPSWVSGIMLPTIWVILLPISERWKGWVNLRSLSGVGG